MNFNMNKIFTIFLLLIFADVAAMAQDNSTDAPAKIISGKQFQLTEKDQADGIYGSMKLALRITKTGDVEKAVVYLAPGWPCKKDLTKRVNEIMRDAENLALSYKFSPEIKNGQAVETDISIRILLTEEKHDETGQHVQIINGGVLNGKARSLPIPPYPSEARMAKTSGTVSVKILIDVDGLVLRAQAIDGPAILQPGSRYAACEAKFRPTTLKGAPTMVSGVITYNYVP